MYKNGGYAIVSHDDIDIYSKVKGAFENHKPILFYDDDNTCYFIDTIKKNDDGDYILTKGGKTFTVTTNNTLSSEGEIQVIDKHLYRYCINMSIVGGSPNDICCIELYSEKNVDLLNSFDVIDFLNDELTTNQEFILTNAYITVGPSSFFALKLYKYAEGLKISGNTLSGDYQEIIFNSTNFGFTNASKTQLF